MKKKTTVYNNVYPKRHQDRKTNNIKTVESVK